MLKGLIKKGFVSMKIIINKGQGVFDFSEEAISRIKEAGLDGIEEHELRVHPKVIEIVQELGDKANTSFSKLSVIEIPDNIECFIQDYEGMEWVVEAHRTWE